MNISSVVVRTNPESIEEVVQILKDSELCEFHLHDDKGRIIVTVEATKADGEVAVLQQLQAIPNVLSADLVYAYSEDELNQEREQLEHGENIPDWLNDENAKLRDIKYQGDLKGKF